MRNLLLIFFHIHFNFFVPCLTVYLPLNWNLQINFTKGIFWRKIMPFIIFKYLQFNVQVANKTNNYIWCSIVHTTHFFSSGFDLLRSNQLMFPSPCNKEAKAEKLVKHSFNYYFCIHLLRQCIILIQYPSTTIQENTNVKQFFV